MKKFLKNEDYFFNNFLILTNIFLKYSNKVFIQDVYLFSVTFTVVYLSLLQLLTEITGALTSAAVTDDCQNHVVFCSL